MPRRAIAAFVALAALALLAACREADGPDAYGHVEATEVTVAAEVGGVVERFSPRQGERLAAGAVVGWIDTELAELESHQVAAQREAAAARLDEIAEQVDVLEAELGIARRTAERTRRLFDRRAATAAELDRADTATAVLGERIEATRAQAEAVRREVAAADARLAQVAQRIARARVVNPIAGTVLETFVRVGELAAPGQPLYRVADLSTVEVRAYVAETQLAGLRLGQPARVTVDLGPERRTTLPGTVAWISSEAEFTPTPIQTREERADLVYAIEVRVANEAGLLKIGMPVDVELGAAPAAG